VAINRVPVLSIVLANDDAQRSSCVLPIEVSAGKQDVAIEIAAGRVRSPFGVARSKDDRLLGVQLTSIRLRPVVALELGSPIDLTQPEIADAVLAHNWHPPEPEGVWSSGRSGTLYLVLADDADLSSLREPIRRPVRRRDRPVAAPAHLLAVARVMQASPEAPIGVSVAINGQPCGETLIVSPDFRLIDIPVPVDLLAPGRCVADRHSALPSCIAPLLGD
jgi:hypothetical protein